MTTVHTRRAALTVLGRALLDRDGDVWRQHPDGGDRWRDRLTDPEAEWWPVATVALWWGPVREVLLVDPTEAHAAREALAGAPAEHAPGVQPDWCGYLTREAAGVLRRAGADVLAEHVEALERWHAAGNREHESGGEVR